MRYIATDLDDTLLYPVDNDNFVCAKNREVIKKFDGVLIASGRNCEFIKNVCKELNIEENFVAYNGACVYKNGKEKYKKYLDKETVNKIVNYVKEHFTSYSIILLTDDNKIYTLNTDDDKRQKEEKERIKKTPKLGYISIKDKKEIEEILNSENRLMKFEDKEFSGMKYYDEYLKKMYGDYMKLPPKEKQIAEHGVEIYEMKGGI